MGFNDDFIDPLVEEILTDVAGSFFEKRRQLDERASSDVGSGLARLP